MPSLVENIKYVFKRYILPKEGVLLHLAKAAFGLLILAFLLEYFVFNFNHYATAGYDTINLRNSIDLRQNANEQFLLTEHYHEIEFSNLNTEVRNLAVLFDTSQPAQEIQLKIQFTDEAHLTYFDTTEYTEGIPLVDVSTSSRQSQFINLNTTGLMTSLKIAVVGDNVHYPLYLDTVEINAQRPFDFNYLRFFTAFVILVLIYAFRPRSIIYRTGIKENPRKSKMIIISAVAIECILATSFLLFGSNLVGVATSEYNQGEWDGTSVVNFFEVGGDNAQQYAELAKSFAHGKLYLEEDPPDWLKEMSSPYDRGARDELQKETGQDYLFDVAYYDGKYYVYFGVVPVLLFYLPFYLLTGLNFPTAIGVLIAILLFIAGVSALLDRFARYHFEKVSIGLYLLMQIALVSGCGILYLLKFPTFYSLPLSCGLAFSVWGLYFWMRGRMSKSHRAGCYIAGSLCMALVLGCRPQLVLLSLLAFPIFWRYYITNKKILSKKGAKEFVCLIAPYIVVGVAIMLYNHARFGSFTDFGANYNLTVNDMTQRGWVFGRFAPAFFAYFIQAPNVSGVFPYLQPVVFATTYIGQTIKEATFGGIFACYPVLWILLLAAPIARLRNDQRETRTITGVIFVLLLSGLVIAMVDAQMAGILQRYYADFSLMFFATVVLLVFIVNENLKGELTSPNPAFSAKKLFCKNPKKVFTYLLLRQRIAKKRRHDELYREGALAKSLMLKALLLMVGFGVIYSTLLCLTPETGWYADIYDWAYRDVLETIVFWT